MLKYNNCHLSSLPRTNCPAGVQRIPESVFQRYLQQFVVMTNTHLCPPACSTVQYHVKLRKSERSFFPKVILSFSWEVTEVRQRLQHSALSFLTTLGGHIGVCRTLLWGLLALLGLHAVLPANVKAMLIA